MQHLLCDHRLQAPLAVHRFLVVEKKEKKVRTTHLCLTYVTLSLSLFVVLS